MPALLINNVDATTLGFVLTEAPSWLDLPPQMTPSQPVIGKQGTTVTAAPIEGMRRITLRGLVTSASVAQTRTNIDNLKLALLAPLVQLTFQDTSTRYIIAGLDGFTVVWSGPAMLDRRVRVEIQMSAFDPYFYDIATTTVASAATMALGTGLVRPTITITATGANAGPILVILRKNDNTIVGTLTINVALATSDVLVVDMNARTVKKNGASILNLITAGDFWVADPATHIQAGVGPKVDAVTNATVSVAYQKSWR